MTPVFFGLLFLHEKEAIQYWNALQECIGVESKIENVYFDFMERKGINTYSAIKGNDLYIYGSSVQRKMRISFLFKRFAEAWFDSGVFEFDLALRDWINDCASAKVGSPYLNNFTGNYLEYMIDMNSKLDLSYKENQKDKKEFSLIKKDTIESRTRFVRAISRVFDFKGVYPINFNVIVEKMKDSVYVSQFFEFLNGDLESQKIALSDVDLDGLTNLEESFLKTDPGRWDTDGDGWWDGQQPVPGAVAVRPMGGEVCLGVLPSRNFYRVRSGGQERHRYELEFKDGRENHIFIQSAFPVIRVGVEIVDEWIYSGKLFLPTDQSITFEFREYSSKYPHLGGLWVALDVRRSVPDPYCLSTPMITLRTMNRSLSLDLKALNGQIEALVTCFSLSPLPPETRSTMRLGGADILLFEGEKPTLSTAAVRALQKLPDGVASGIVAAWAARRFPVPIRAAIAEGFLQHLTSQETSSVFSSNTEMVAETHRVAAACPTGWRGLIDGSCVLR